MDTFRSPRLPELLLRIVLPRSEHATIIGELQEEYREQVRPDRGRFRAALWYWSECLSLVAAYLKILLVREHSRELSVVIEARKTRKRTGRPDNSRELTTRLDSLLQDIRQGYRSLKNRPSFTLAALLTLAIGIGVNAAVFSILYSVMIKPLPYHNAEALVAIHRTSPAWGRNGQASVAYPDFTAWEERNQVFEEMTAWHTITVNLTGVGEPERIDAAEISHDLFEVLGVSPLSGRTFRPDEDRFEAPGTVILGHGLWQRRFGSDPGIVGSIIHLDKEPHTVIGIAPRGFRFPDVVDLWRPGRADPDHDRDVMIWWIAARLADGISIDQAQTHLSEIDAALQVEFPQAGDPLGVGLIPLKSRLTGEIGGAVAIFYIVVSLVLLLVCANIANLMLALSTTRQTEIAIRASLGAGRTRIARQLLTESIMLSICGGMVGIGLGLAGRDLILRYIPLEIPSMLRFHTDLPLLLLLIGIMILTGILFGLAPALTATRHDLAGLLQRGSSRASSSISRARLRASLIVFEVTVATFLLIGSGFFMKSYLALTDRENGIDRENVLTLQISLPEADYPDEPSQRLFFRDITDRIRAVPGVITASVITPMPFGSSRWRRGFTIEGIVSEEGQQQLTPFWAVQGDYFQTMGIPILSGRSFDDISDQEGAPPVVIVTDAFASRHWPGEDPLGKRLKWGRPDSDRSWMEVIGVVGDIAGLDPTEESGGGCYTTLSDIMNETMSLAIRTTDDPMAFVAPVKSILGEIDPDLPAYGIDTLEEIFARTFWPIAASSWFFIVLTAISLLLAAVGIYGVVSYSVSRRTREFGIRMTLGAHSRELIGLVLGQLSRQAGLGLVIGTLLALGLAQVASGLLYGVSPLDPTVYLLTILLMGGSALVAAWIPARRATLADPMETLRQE